MGNVTYLPIYLSTYLPIYIYKQESYAWLKSRQFYMRLKRAWRRLR